MRDLRQSRINLDKVSVSGLRLKHEIEAVQTGKVQATRHFFRGGGHFGVIDQAKNARRSGRNSFIDYLKMETGQHLPFPANDRGGSFTSRHKRLRIHDRTATKERGPDKSSVLIDQGSLDSARQKRRSLQRQQGTF